MARDLSIDLEVNPILDTRATKNLVSTLEKELRSVKSGQHLPLARRASSVMRGLMDSGVATTSTQARIILADMMGGGFSSQQKAVLRSAQNITSAQLFLEKTNRIQQQRISSVAARAATLSNQYQVFAYDSSYGNLKSILDPNGFETISGWTKSTVTVNGFSYFVYVTNSQTTDTNAAFTFKY